MAGGGGTWRDGTGTLAVPGRAEPVAVVVAASYRSRRRGLLGRDGIAGAMLLARCNSVHTFGMRFAIDVAYLDRGLRVLDVVTMPPGRLGTPRWRARLVLEAEAGALARWGVGPGVRLAVTADPRPAG
ncbi:DUF192 domain-containing protein [Streptomyces sp. ODS05-4]|uniref:DUF192 domain-containing protein n=1 Tax=Streptomyces sp. ODS05-4 TaxID=2944939 RepID=UPI00210EFE4D|nr:DUF192 domain-containing protein [Streptomyces sp. ODS05-4]